MRESESGHFSKTFFEVRVQIKVQRWQHGPWVSLLVRGHKKFYRVYIYGRNHGLLKSSSDSPLRIYHLHSTSWLQASHSLGATSSAKKRTVTTSSHRRDSSGKKKGKCDMWANVYIWIKFKNLYGVFSFVLVGGQGGLALTGGLALAGGQPRLAPSSA